MTEAERPLEGPKPLEERIEVNEVPPGYTKQRTILCRVNPKTGERKKGKRKGYIPAGTKIVKGTPITLCDGKDEDHGGFMLTTDASLFVAGISIGERTKSCWITTDEQATYVLCRDPTPQADLPELSEGLAAEGEKPPAPQAHTTPPPEPPQEREQRRGRLARLFSWRPSWFRGKEEKKKK